MSKLAGNTRAALLGVLFAMVGFSYALATSAGLSEASASAAGRAVGTNVALQFTNPFVSAYAPADPNATDRDLGDAVAGSAFARYCRAKGGCPPYKFTGTGDKDGQWKLSSLDLGLTLLTNGLVTPVAGTTTINPKATLGAKRFRVDVTDSSGTNTGNSAWVHEMFRITIFDSSVFKFAMGPDLGSAVKFQSVSVELVVINGKAPLTFGTVDKSVKLDGTAVDSLEAIGLALGNDGILYGAPLAPGKLEFTATCLNADKAPAYDRTGTKPNQDFFLQIDDNGLVSSAVVTTALQIKGGAGGKDTIKYAGIANLMGKKPSDLAGKTITLRIGKYTTPNTTATPATLDDKGKTIKSTADKTILKTAVSEKSAVSSKGQVKIAIGKETFGALGTTNAFGVLKAGSGVLLGVSIDVAGVATRSEVLPCDIVPKGDKYTITYKQGMAVPAGAFLITTCAGKDDTKGSTGDSWKVAFLAQPPAGNAGKSPNLTAGSFAGAKTATVSIGFNLTDTIPVLESKNKIKSMDKSVKALDQVSKLAMDSVKGKGSMQTTFLASDKTGILMANKAKLGTVGATDFGMNISLDSTAGYAGAGGKVIFSSGKAWSDKTPKY
ncbi:MAG: hypothetical protein NTW87_06960 [Planctomycetota bacterium]|nr:hypothetical protein [Planctomycetota bacterium]